MGAVQAQQPRQNDALTRGYEIVQGASGSTAATIHTRPSNELTQNLHDPKHQRVPNSSELRRAGGDSDEETFGEFEVIPFPSTPSSQTQGTPEVNNGGGSVAPRTGKIVEITEPRPRWGK